MRFFAGWDATALDALAQIGLQATDRQAVTTASHQVDQRLEFTPETKGTDFYGD